MGCRYICWSCLGTLLGVLLHFVPFLLLPVHIVSLQNLLFRLHVPQLMQSLLPSFTHLLLSEALFKISAAVSPWLATSECCKRHLACAVKGGHHQQQCFGFCFVQDDGHIFCLPDQIATEIRGVLDMVEYVMGALGFSQLEINLSTKPAKAVGSDEIWERAEDALREALHTKGWDYKIDEGGGAFYGPKIDVKIQDVLGRKWQCSTIQLDFNLPERFQMVS